MIVEPMGDALRGDPPALRRVGVVVDRPPWWRRSVQSRLFPARYRLWLQRYLLASLDAKGDRPM